MSIRVKRFDLSDLNGVSTTPQGYLRAPALVTRTGVLKYMRADGSVRRELRLPEEVFKHDSMATLASIPVTLEHPKKMLDAENTKDAMVGFTSDSVKKEDRYLKTTFTVTDAEAIQAITRDAKRQVSCGYYCDHEEAPGVWEGEEYDVIQRNIVYNHVAIVTRGRAGHDVRIKLDSADAISSEETEMEGNEKMAKLKIGEKEYDVAPEAAEAMQGVMSSHAKEMDSMKSQMDDFKKKVGEDQMALQKKAEAEKEEGGKKMDELKAKLDAAEEQLKTRTDSVDEAKIQERVKARVALVSIATRVLPAETKMDDLSDREIKTLVIAASGSKAEMKDQSDAYVNARFDAAAEQIEAAGKNFRVVPKVPTTDASDAEAARKKMIEDSMSAWKQPLSQSKQA